MFLSAAVLLDCVSPYFCQIFKNFGQVNYEKELTISASLYATTYTFRIIERFETKKLKTQT